MELNDIIQLVKAGYAKHEIEQMDKPQPSNPDPVPVQQPAETPVQNDQPTDVPAPVVAPVAAAVPVPQPVPQPQQQPAQAKPVEPAQPSMADIMQGIAKLTSAVQANAIAQSVIPQGLSNPPSAEDMLAEIIRPTYHERS